MRFNIRKSNYSRAGKAAADEVVNIHAAARRNSPDYGKMVQQAANIRSAVKRAGISAAADVSVAGINAAAKVEKDKIVGKAKRGLKKEQRKAGALGVAGSMFNQAGTLLGEKRDRREVGSEDSFYDSLTEKNDSKLADLRKKLEDLKPPSTEDSTQTSTDSSSSGEIISSGQAISAGKGTSGKGGRYTQAQMTSFAEQAGFSPDQARVMGAIGMGESGGNSGIDTVASGLDPGRTNEYSVGLFQINAQAHGDKLAKLGYTADDLRDPVKNAQVAKLVYDEVGSFMPWTVYKTGDYEKYL